MAVTRLLAAVLVTCLTAGVAQAAPAVVWLPQEPRAIPETTSASRDAPVLEWAYGPRAQASVGHAFGIAAWDNRQTRLGVTALLALEDGSAHAAFPTEFLRHRLEVSLAWLLPRLARTWLPPHAQLELALRLGHDGPSGRMVGPDAIRADDLPFGAGGGYLAVDAAARIPTGPAWTWTPRLGLRLYTNVFPWLFSQTASNAVADGLREGALVAVTAEIGGRYRWKPKVNPMFSLFGQWLAAHDASAHDARFARLLAGLALKGRAGELTPFVSLDIGNGMGVLVNRDQLRLSAGVRHAF